MLHSFSIFSRCNSFLALKFVYFHSEHSTWRAIFCIHNFIHLNVSYANSQRWYMQKWWKLTGLWEKSSLITIYEAIHESWMELEHKPQTDTANLHLCNCRKISRIRPEGLEEWEAIYSSQSWPLITAQSLSFSSVLHFSLASYCSRPLPQMSGSSKKIFWRVKVSREKK